MGRDMPIRFASFNVFGIGGRDVTQAVDAAAVALPPTDPAVSAVAFQEVWHRAQLTLIVDRWVGAGSLITTRTNVDIHRAPNGAWRCLVPVVPPVNPPVGPELPLSSGLALCVRGPVDDSFFSPFRGGEVPDRFANKGVLAALVRTPGQPRRAVVATHFHDYSNDAWGRARNNNLDVLSSSVSWIKKNWKVPIVLLGDFNINSKAAYAHAHDAYHRLYSRLVRLTMARDAAWWDVNARFTALQPMATHGNGKAIDHHLGSDPGVAAVPMFQALPGAGSDHLLTISQWL